MNPMTRDFKTLVVAGGCFWGVEAYYRKLNGVVDTNVGYANGNSDTTSYREVCTGKTGHAEAVMVYYNPAILTVTDIVDHLFRMTDPTSLNKQGNDVGTQYRTGVYATNQADKDSVNAYIASRQADYQRDIVIEVETLQNYMVAEPEHQSYLAENPGGYCHIDFSTIKKHELKDQT